MSKPTWTINPGNLREGESYERCRQAADILLDYLATRYSLPVCFVAGHSDLNGSGVTPKDTQQATDTFADEMWCRA